MHCNEPGGKFGTGTDRVVDTGVKLASGINDTGGKFANVVINTKGKY